MNIIRISCKACGTPLAVSEGIRHLACHQCGARLEVVYDTEPPRVRISEPKDGEVLKLQMELERLDEARRHSEEMTRVRQSLYWSRGPAITSLEDFGFYLAVVGLVVTVMSLVHGWFFPQSLIGVAMVVIGIVCRVKGCEMSAKEEEEYMHQRERLLLRLRALQQPSETTKAPSPRIRDDTKE